MGLLVALASMPACSTLWPVKSEPSKTLPATAAGSGSGAARGSGSGVSGDDEAIPRANLGTPVPPLALQRNDGRRTQAILDETFRWVVSFPTLYGNGAYRRVAQLLVNFSTLAGRLEPGATMAGITKPIIDDAQALATDPGWFGYTDHTRSGLLASIDALERFAKDRSPGIMVWVDSARSSAKAIRSEDPFGIQRIAIQDALRSVADAYRAALESVSSSRT